MTSEIIKSVSIEALVAKRDRIVANVKKAHELLCDAEEQSEETHTENELARYRNWHIHLEFSGRGGSFTSERGVIAAVKKLDAGFWSYLLAESGLQSFLDAKAREDWRKAIEKEDVPELTVANIEATFGALYKARGGMFERGVIELFEKLSHDYKTNTPIKLGRRLILTYAVDARPYKGKTDTYGVAYRAADKLDDLLRVMSVLDKKPEPDHRNGAYHTLNEQHWMRDGGPNVADVHGYYSIKGHKNGNGHVTFLRPDLVDQMNQIIAKHFPNALAPRAEDT